MKKKYFEDMEFYNDQEITDYLTESTNEFNVIDFYNGDGVASAIIVITPYQTIKIGSVDRHGDAVNWLYELLYGEYSNEELININNIVIRMVRGSSYTFYPLLPKGNIITNYQYESLKNIVSDLDNYKEDINFKTEADLVMFEATYNDSKNKLASVNIVDEINAPKELYSVNDGLVK